MATVLASLGATSGILAVITGIIVIGRGIFRQVNATEDLTKTVGTLIQSVNELKTVLGGHETRISILEDRLKR